MVVAETLQVRALAVSPDNLSESHVGEEGNY